MMKNVRKISKKYYLRQIVSCWLVFYMFFCFGIPAQVAMAAPQGGAFQGVDTGTIDDGVTDSTVLVNQMESVIHWDGLNTSDGESLTFTQLGGLSNAAVLNRVVGEGASIATLFDGELSGVDMRIFMINPAGIVFGENAVVNVSQLVASSLNLTDVDFRNGAPYTFTDGATAGEVRNESLDTITAERIYLIGKTVTNIGSLRALDGYVVLAAGDTVTISEVGSAVAVEVTLPPLVDTGEYIVDHHGGDGKINAQHVILAAGDVWASAYIKAYSDGGSDAVASVDIDAVGDVTIDGEIMAEAEADGGEDNAFASVLIDAGGDVTINDYVIAEADAEDGAGNATATVDIIADGSVTVNSSVDADAWVDENSGNATATVDITSLGGDVDTYDDVSAEADTRDGSGNAVAKAEITAHGDVDIDGRFRARAEAVDSGNATADTIITGENIDIDDGGENTAIITRAITNSNTVNTGDAVGNTVIAAREDVTVNGSIKTKVSSNDAGDATSDIKISGVDIDINAKVISRTQAGFHYLGEYESEDGYSGDATSGIDITASGIVNVDAVVKSNAEAENNSGSASATTKIVGTEVNITGGESNEDRHGNDVDQSVVAFANTYDNSGNATANVDIEATTGDVDIDTDGYPVMAEAGVEDPDTEYTGDSDAGVTITAAGDVDIYDLVKAEADAEEDAGNATAKVDITADGSVTIHENGEDYMVQADVWVNDNSGSGEATLNITALGGDVDIYDDVKAEAETSDNSGDATATLDIDASGNVNIYQDEDDTVKARASVENPDTEYEGDATATLNITAGADGDVYVDDNVEAEAEADGDAGDADAAVTITAGRDILLSHDVDADADTDNGSGDASATLTINATRDVTIDDDDVEADADSDHSGNATAILDIDAGRDVLLEDGASDTKADAEVSYAKGGSEGDATATVTVNAGGDLTLDGSEGNAELEADADTDHGSGDADASITIVADNVYLYGDSGDDAEIEVDADADYDSGNATGTIDITLTGSDVIVDGSDADIEIDASTNHDSGDAEATILIKDAENVTVSDGGEINADADTDNRSGDATATVDIDASGTVTVEDEGSRIKAETDVDNDGGPDGSSSSATSVVDIDAGGDVIVGEDGEVYADADVDNYDNWQINTFTGNADADVYITALGEVIVDGLVKAEADVYNRDDHECIEAKDNFPGDIYSGSSYANVTIDNILGNGVTVGPYGEIIADSAFINYDYPDQRFENNVYSGVALAGIDIQTCGDAIVDGLVSSKAFIDPIGTYDAVPENDDYSQTMVADVIIKAFGDVIVNSEHEEENGIVLLTTNGNGNGGSNGQILAVASNGEENSADVTILAVGDVIVNDGSGRIAQVVQINGDGLHSPEEIRAEASGGSTNNADVRIATREGFGGDLIVSGQIGAHTYSEGKEDSEHTNTSNVEICVDRDVIVNGGYALYGQGERPILLESHEGGRIFAGAQGNGQKVKVGEDLVSFNNANVEIYAGRDVTVHGAELEYTELIPNGGESLTLGNGGGFYDGGQILAMTGWSDNSENTSSIGIYAQDDVTINDVTVTGEPMSPIMLSPSSNGQVIAGAHGNDSIDTAEIEICAQDDVTIDGVVRAEAGTGTGGEHYAHIRIAAGDLLAGGIGGSIIADADPAAAVAEASVTFLVTGLGNLGFDGLAYSTTDRGATQVEPDVVVGPVDCPECDFDWIDWDWCEDCDVPAPVAALAQFQIPTIEGCPELTQAAAMELGITAETIQVGIGNALALNPTIQPCEACAALVDAASILRDEDGSRMAAMVQTFNALAPADAPFTPEMATSIAMAFEGAAEGSQYASAMEYVDAFVEYVAVLDTGMGSPVSDDSVAFVMEKYGAGITGSDNANIAAFVVMRLEAIGE